MIPWPMHVKPTSFTLVGRVAPRAPVKPGGCPATFAERAERRALPRVLRGLPLILLICLASRPALLASETPVYNFETNIVYGLVAGKELTLNAFLPAGQTSSVPAIVDIHGGWWFGGGKAARIEHIGGWQWFERHGLAVFSIEYRLGGSGGFPESIRDCRNA